MTTDSAAGAPVRLNFDAFELDEGNARLTRQGAPLSLPPKAFAVLCTLARRPGHLVTKEQLLGPALGGPCHRATDRARGASPRPGAPDVARRAGPCDLDGLSERARSNYFFAREQDSATGRWHAAPPLQPKSSPW